MCGKRGSGDCVKKEVDGSTAMYSDGYVHECGMVSSHSHRFVSYAVKPTLHM